MWSSHLLLEDVRKQSSCELEVDIVAMDILNRVELEGADGINPGLLALWNIERERKIGKPMSSQLFIPESQDRGIITSTQSEKQWKSRLQEIIVEQQNTLQKELEQFEWEDSVYSLQSSHDIFSVTPSSTIDTNLSPNINTDEEDNVLSELLTCLEKDLLPTQSIETQAVALEEQDSILGSMQPRADDSDELITIEMSQSIWDNGQRKNVDEERKSGNIAHDSSNDFDNAGAMSSHKLEKEVPQLDGAGDDVAGYKCSKQIECNSQCATPIITTDNCLYNDTPILSSSNVTWTNNVMPSVVGDLSDNTHDSKVSNNQPQDILSQAIASSGFPLCAEDDVEVRDNCFPIAKNDVTFENNHHILGVNVPNCSNDDTQFVLQHPHPPWILQPGYNEQQFMQSQSHVRFRRIAPYPSNFSLQSSVSNVFAEKDLLYSSCKQLSLPKNITETCTLPISHQTNAHCNPMDAPHNFVLPPHFPAQPMHAMPSPVHAMPSPVHAMPSPVHSMPSPVHSSNMQHNNMVFYQNFGGPFAENHMLMQHEGAFDMGGAHQNSYNHQSMLSPLSLAFDAMPLQSQMKQQSLHKMSEPKFQKSHKNGSAKKRLNKSSAIENSSRSKMKSNNNLKTKNINVSATSPNFQKSIPSTSSYNLNQNVFSQTLSVGITQEPTKHQILPINSEESSSKIRHFESGKKTNSSVVCKKNSSKNLSGFASTAHFTPASNTVCQKSSPSKLHEKRESNFVVEGKKPSFETTSTDFIHSPFVPELCKPVNSVANPNITDNSSALSAVESQASGSLKGQLDVWVKGFSFSSHIEDMIDNSNRMSEQNVENDKLEVSSNKRTQPSNNDSQNEASNKNDCTNNDRIEKCNSLSPEDLLQRLEKSEYAEKNDDIIEPVTPNSEFLASLHNSDDENMDLQSTFKSGPSKFKMFLNPDKDNLHLDMKDLSLHNDESHCDINSCETGRNYSPNFYHSTTSNQTFPAAAKENNNSVPKMPLVFESRLNNFLDTSMRKHVSCDVSNLAVRLSPQPTVSKLPGHPKNPGISKNLDDMYPLKKNKRLLSKKARQNQQISECDIIRSTQLLGETLSKQREISLLENNIEQTFQSAQIGSDDTYKWVNSQFTREFTDNTTLSKQLQEDNESNMFGSGSIKKPNPIPPTYALDAKYEGSWKSDNLPNFVGQKRQPWMDTKYCKDKDDVKTAQKCYREMPWSLSERHEHSIFSDEKHCNISSNSFECGPLNLSGNLVSPPTHFSCQTYDSRRISSVQPLEAHYHGEKIHPVDVSNVKNLQSHTFDTHTSWDVQAKDDVVQTDVLKYRKNNQGIQKNKKLEDGCIASSLKKHSFQNSMNACFEQLKQEQNRHHKISRSSRVESPINEEATFSQVSSDLSSNFEDFDTIPDLDDSNQHFPLDLYDPCPPDMLYGKEVSSQNILTSKHCSSRAIDLSMDSVDFNQVGDSLSSQKLRLKSLNRKISKFKSAFQNIAEPKPVPPSPFPCLSQLPSCFKRSKKLSPLSKNFKTSPLLKKTKKHLKSEFVHSAAQEEVYQGNILKAPTNHNIFDRYKKLHIPLESEVDVSDESYGSDDDSLADLQPSPVNKLIISKTKTSTSNMKESWQVMHNSIMQVRSPISHGHVKHQKCASSSPHKSDQIIPQRKLIYKKDRLNTKLFGKVYRNVFRNADAVSFSCETPMNYHQSRAVKSTERKTRGMDQTKHCVKVLKQDKIKHDFRKIGTEQVILHMLSDWDIKKVCADILDGESLDDIMRGFKRKSNLKKNVRKRRILPSLADDFFQDTVRMQPLNTLVIEVKDEDNLETKSLSSSVKFDKDDKNIIAVSDILDEESNDEHVMAVTDSLEQMPGRNKNGTSEAHLENSNDSCLFDKVMPSDDNIHSYPWEGRRFGDKEVTVLIKKLEEQYPDIFKNKTVKEVISSGKTLLCKDNQGGVVLVLVDQSELVIPEFSNGSIHPITDSNSGEMLNHKNMADKLVGKKIAYSLDDKLKTYTINARNNASNRMFEDSDESDNNHRLHIDSPVLDFVCDGFNDNNRMRRKVRYSQNEMKPAKHISYTPDKEDYIAQYQDVMYNFSLYSPESDHGVESPPMPLSPEQLEETNESLPFVLSPQRQNMSKLQSQLKSMSSNKISYGDIRNFGSCNEDVDLVQNLHKMYRFNMKIESDYDVSSSIEGSDSPSPESKNCSLQNGDETILSPDTPEPCLPVLQALPLPDYHHGDRAKEKLSLLGEGYLHGSNHSGDELLIMDANATEDTIWHSEDHSSYKSSIISPGSCSLGSNSLHNASTDGEDCAYTMGRLSNNECSDKEQICDYVMKPSCETDEPNFEKEENLVSENLSSLEGSVQNSFYTDDKTNMDCVDDDDICSIQIVDVRSESSDASYHSDDVRNLFLTSSCAPEKKTDNIFDIIEDKKMKISHPQADINMSLSDKSGEIQKSTNPVSTIPVVPVVSGVTTNNLGNAAIYAKNLVHCQKTFEGSVIPDSAVKDINVAMISSSADTKAYNQLKSTSAEIKTPERTTVLAHSVTGLLTSMDRSQSNEDDVKKDKFPFSGISNFSSAVNSSANREHKPNSCTSVYRPWEKSSKPLVVIATATSAIDCNVACAVNLPSTPSTGDKITESIVEKPDKISEPVHSFTEQLMKLRTEMKKSLQPKLDHDHTSTSDKIVLEVDLEENTTATDVSASKMCGSNINLENKQFSKYSDIDNTAHGNICNVISQSRVSKQNSKSIWSPYSMEDVVSSHPQVEYNSTDLRSEFEVKQCEKQHNLSKISKSDGQVTQHSVMNHGLTEDTHPPIEMERQQQSVVPPLKRNIFFIDDLLDRNETVKTSETSCSVQEISQCEKKIIEPFYETSEKYSTVSSCVVAVHREHLTEPTAPLIIDAVIKAAMGRTDTIMEMSKNDTRDSDVNSQELTDDPPNDEMCSNADEDRKKQLKRKAKPFYIMQTKLAPPSRQQVINSCDKYGLPLYSRTFPFYHNDNKGVHQVTSHITAGLRENNDAMEAFALREFESSLPSKLLKQHMHDTVAERLIASKIDDCLSPMELLKTNNLIKYQFMTESDVIMTPCELPPKCFEGNVLSTTKPNVMRTCVEDSKELNPKEVNPIEVKNAVLCEHGSDLHLSTDGRNVSEVMSQTTSDEDTACSKWILENIGSKDLFSPDSTRANSMESGKNSVSVCYSKRFNRSRSLDVCGPILDLETKQPSRIDCHIESKKFTPKPLRRCSSYETFSVPTSSSQIHLDFTDVPCPTSTPITHKITATGSGKQLNSALKLPLKKGILARHKILPLSPQCSVTSQIDAVNPLHTTTAFNSDKDDDTLPQCQHLTILSVEVHCRSRGDLLPDPEFDEIRAIFYCLHDEASTDDGAQQTDSGAIIVDEAIGTDAEESHPSCGASESVKERSGIHDLNVEYVASESILFEALFALVQKADPDIFVGYEIDKFSWGYLSQRAPHLNINFGSRISRIPESEQEKHDFERSESQGVAHVSVLYIAGRIVLNLWRIMRHEVTLNLYTFENVAFNVLHQRVPLFTYRSLTKWFDQSKYRWKVINHFFLRARGSLKIMEKINLIGRTSEFARIFGIEFYHVLSRGTQYRVESMMLRMAKPLNYIPLSPSVQQRARQRAPEVIPLTLEPESRFYSDPVVVLDFQSLYPSLMIAYNYCYSTCLGRVENLAKAAEGCFSLGCGSLSITPQLLKQLENDITFSPTGVAFVKSHVRHGIIPRMVEDILSTRLMIKKKMKKTKNNAKVTKLLDSRQLGLKLIANVTFGYTSANFSGRMPMVEVGDSIVGKARETLERAIQLVNETEDWGSRVIYGDTDSLFILMKGKSVKEAFKIGQQICDSVTASNPKPVKLKLEKVYMPCVLQTKKRYAGYMFESPDQCEPTFHAKGIETVRRDNCPAVSKILEKSLHLLFKSKDISLIKHYVQNQLKKIMEFRVSLQDLTFAKEFRGMNGYRPGVCIPSLEIAKRLVSKDRRANPCVGERVPYVVVYGTPGLPLIRLIRQPMIVLQDTSLRINVTYYIYKAILPPLARVFSLLGVDVFSWYAEMPCIARIDQAVPTNKKGTIAQYFNTQHCPLCDGLTNQDICDNCKDRPQLASSLLCHKARLSESQYRHLQLVCFNCTGNINTDISCVSLDCPILYRMVKVTRKMEFMQSLHNIQLFW